MMTLKNLCTVADYIGKRKPVSHTWEISPGIYNCQISHSPELMTKTQPGFVNGQGFSISEAESKAMKQFLVMYTQRYKIELQDAFNNIENDSKLLSYITNHVPKDKTLSKELLLITENYNHSELRTCLQLLIIN